MRLVYISPVPWASFSQRPHKFADWFHKRTDSDVLWLDPYPTRFPRLHDFPRLRSATTGPQQDGQPPWLRVVAPAALPIEPLPGSGWVNRSLWASVIDQVEEFVSGQQALFVIGKPSVLALTLLDRFEGYPSLYDAMDNFPAFYSGLSRYAMARRELEVIRAVDSVWTSSTSLRDRWRHRATDVQLVRNALDAEAVAEPSVPLSRCREKVFGYIGTIAVWFDWSWVCALAELRPHDIVRLIGPVVRRPSTVLPANVEILPPCDHAAALRTMRHFDVGLIPFKRTELTASVDPIKYYEYRAFGLPVISTNFGEMRYRSSESGVFISNSVEDIADRADVACRYSQTTGVAARFIRENSWDMRFDEAKLALLWGGASLADRLP